MELKPLAEKVFRRSAVYTFVNGVASIVAAVSYIINAQGLEQENSLHQLVFFTSSFTFTTLSIISYFFCLKTVFGKKRFHTDKDSTENAELQALRGILTNHSLLDAVNLMIICRLLGFESYPPLSAATFMHDFVVCIPKCFVFELIFDFFHYWTHRMCHVNKFLYKHVHLDHHTHTHPGILSTYSEHPLDYLVTNCIPMLLTVSLGPSLSPFQLQLVLSYKHLIEVGGHAGLENTFGFPQFPFLAWCSDRIILISEDHSWHHCKPNKNFSKRLAVWDHVFGTYEKSRFDSRVEKRLN